MTADAGASPGPLDSGVGPPGLVDLRIQPYAGRYFAALAEAMVELDRHYFGERGAGLAEVEASLRAGMLGPDSGVRVLLAIDGDAVAGLATFTLLYPAPEQRGQLFMKDLFVRERWRGRGVGERLMRHLAAHAVARGCVRFDWTTENTNAGAMAFYERLGATPVRQKVYYRLTGADLQALAQDTITPP
jgi:ribosomal protein S18 acetylase RimI-like enzyme